MEKEERDSAYHFTNNLEELYSELKLLSQHKYKGKQNNLLQKKIKQKIVLFFLSLRKVGEVVTCEIYIP